MTGSVLLAISDCWKKDYTQNESSCSLGLEGFQPQKSCQKVFWGATARVQGWVALRVVRKAKIPFCVAFHCCFPAAFTLGLRLKFRDAHPECQRRIPQFPV